MTQHEQIQALTDEITKLRGEVAALSVQVAQASSVQHHYHYPPVMPEPQRLPPSIAPQPWGQQPEHLPGSNRHGSVDVGRESGDWFAASSYLSQSPPSPKRGRPSNLSMWQSSHRPPQSSGCRLAMSFGAGQSRATLLINSR